MEADGGRWRQGREVGRQRAGKAGGGASIMNCLIQLFLKQPISDVDADEGRWRQGSRQGEGRQGQARQVEEARY